MNNIINIEVKNFAEDSDGVGSKAWANRQLRFVISVLQGDIVKCSWNGRVSIALAIQARLKDYGFVWQSERISNHMHRLQPRKADPPRGGGRGGTH